MTPSLEGLEGFLCRFDLGLADPPCDPQTRVHVDHRGTPERAVLGGLDMTFFSPLCPT
jgi:hypothetical protein